MSPIFIDVREPSEYAAGHVEGAINIPLGNLGANAGTLAELPRDTELVLYCRSGARAGAGTQQLTSLGFTHVTNGINQAEVEAAYEL